MGEVGCSPMCVSPFDEVQLHQMMFADRDYERDNDDDDDDDEASSRPIIMSPTSMLFEIA